MVEGAHGCSWEGAPLVGHCASGTGWAPGWKQVCHSSAAWRMQFECHSAGLALCGERNVRLVLGLPISTPPHLPNCKHKSHCMHPTHHPTQLPKPELPPPWEEGRYLMPSALVGLKGAPVTQQHHETILLEVEMARRGIQEVGGARWKAVLGAQAVASGAAALMASRP